MRTCLPKPIDCATFLDVLQARSAEHPDDVAYTFLPDGEAGEQSFTYRQIERRAKAIAAAIRDCVDEGERALLLYPPGLEYVSAILACLSAAVVAVPAYPPRTSKSRPNERILAILRDCRPAAVLTISKLLLTAKDCVGGFNIPCIATDEIDAGLATAWREPRISPDDLAVLQYTSGSTAVPKGVMLTHANLIHNSRLVYEAFGHDRRKIGVCWLPPYHDMGLAAGILQPMYAGGPAVLMPPAAFLQRPVRWLAAISRFKATTSGGPNFAYDLCARTISAQDRTTFDLSSWEIAFNGSEPVSASTFERFAQAFAPCGFRTEAFYPCYGLAEATLIVTGGTKLCAPVIGRGPSGGSEGNGAGTAVSCGHARGDGKVIIVDPERLTRCAGGAVGEIWISSGSVALGYWGNVEETQRVFNARTNGHEDGPFLRTGDLGFLREGQLFITGRLKDVINIRGIKHHPEDIERTVLESHPALRPVGAAAFSVQIDGQEQLVILQELERSQRDADPQAVISSIREAVVEHHEIEAYAIVLLRPGQVHRTSSGKVQRFACRQEYRDGGFDAAAQWKAPTAIAGVSQASAPADAASLAEWMTQRLAGAIGVDPSEIDPDEPFARYGLDSVKAAHFAGELAGFVGRDVPLTLFWDYPSITAMARHLMGPPAAVVAP
jgi:acyl-CoA synthetase (AMP-forming)/AMP-acid ligase II